MATLSACVITKNEANNISRCLNSVKNIVQEMLVIDTGSTDETIAIAESLGAKVFHYEWNNDFSAARNYALDQATGDWILFLDADEYIPDDKVQNILPEIEKIHGNRKISSIVCLMQHTEGFNGTIKCFDRTLRLFRNSPAIRYQGRVHETIYKHGKGMFGYFLDKEKLLIIHTGYQSVNITDKVKRNLILLEAELADGNIHQLLYHYLSHSYSVLGQHKKAIEFAYKALEEGSVLQSIFAYKIYLILIHSLQQMENYKPDTIEPILREVMQKYPHHPEIIECQAKYLLSKGHYTKALETFLQALKTNEKYNDISLANEFYSHLPFVYNNMASLYEKMNNPLQALNYYVASLKHLKINDDAFLGLLNLLRKQDVANTVYLLNSIYNVHNETDVVYLVLRLSSQKMLKLLTYYEKMWSENFQKNIIIENKPLLQGNFEQAFQTFSAAFQATGTYDAEVMTVVSVILGNHPEWLNTLDSAVQPAFHRIVSTFFGAETTDLSVEYLSCYIDILDKIVHISTERQLNHFLQMSFSFAANEAPIKIGEVLEKQHLFKKALLIYTHWIAQSNFENELKELYFHAGFCHYKLKEYQQALQYFKQALACGYANPAIYEYQDWIYQQQNGQKSRNIS